MNLWKFLKRRWLILKYVVNFLDKAYGKDLLWSAVEDLGRIMEMLTRLHSHVEPTWFKLNTLSGITENIRHQQIRHEALLQSSLRQGGELERRVARLQQELHGLEKRIQQSTARVQQPAGASVEIELMRHLQEVLTSRCALDIGAHQGAFTQCLLESGFCVHAFEPHPGLYTNLMSRFGHQEGFHGHAMALADVDREGSLQLVSNAGAEDQFPDASLYSTLHTHPLPPGLEFDTTIPVVVRSLASLHLDNTIPGNVDFVKIDAEGQDGLVLLGMGNRRYDIVMAEFWGNDSVFGSDDGKNHLHDMTALMKKRGYSRNIALCCRDGDYAFTYLTDAVESPEQTWGNVLFFQKEAHYLHALDWCRQQLPRNPMCIR